VAQDHVEAVRLYRLAALIKSFKSLSTRNS
jgi:hypothetical protein